MKKTALSALLLALAATGSLRAQTVYLANFNAGQTPNGYISTSNGDQNPFNAPTSGTGGSGAGAISFDNSTASIYSGSLGTYDSTNTRGTSTNVSDYVISFDVRADNLALNTTATVTPSVSLIVGYDGSTSATITGGALTLTSTYTHYSFNASTFTPTANYTGTIYDFGANITNPNYNQTVFQLGLTNLGPDAFNSGTSTIYVDNLQITQVITAVPEPAWGTILGSGLILVCAVRPLRRAFSGLRTA